MWRLPHARGSRFAQCRGVDHGGDRRGRSGLDGPPQSVSHDARSSLASAGAAAAGRPACARTGASKDSRSLVTGRASSGDGATELGGSATPNAPFVLPGLVATLPPRIRARASRSRAERSRDPDHRHARRGGHFGKVSGPRPRGRVCSGSSGTSAGTVIDASTLRRRVDSLAVGLIHALTLRRRIDGRTNQR